MAIKDKLTQLNTTKQGIKEVLQEKGVELAGKTFSDTPALIGQMSVGRGDEVEAFALGEAKHAQVGDKVILNYAADMLPVEAKPTRGTWKGRPCYCDRNRLYATYQGNYIYIDYYMRQANGSYEYTGQVYRFETHEGAWGPFGLIRISNATYLMYENNVKTMGSGSSNNSCLTFSGDYQYALTGGSNAYLLKRVGDTWSKIDKSIGFFNTSYYGYGIINGHLLYLKDNNLTTYTFDDNGTVSIIGTTKTIGFSSYTGWWRFFDNNTKVLIKSSDSMESAYLYVANVTNDGILYSVEKNLELTALLQGYIAQVGVSQVFNIMIVEERDIYLWGKEGVVAIRYMNNTLVHITTPFPDITYDFSFFINPVDKMAIMAKPDYTFVVRTLEAPIVQEYVATKAADGLQFQSVSLIGYVKENKGDVLTVETLTDPNGVIPSYSDTFGLNVTVNAGHPAVTQTWAQPVLTSNGTLGIDDFAVSATSSYDSATQPYNCFSSNDSGLWASNSAVTEANPQYYTFYTTNPIAVKTIVMKNRSAYADEMLGNFVVQSSDDGEAWTDVAAFENRNTEANVLVNFEINETTAHKYHRFKMTTTSAGISGRVSIGRLTIMAQEQAATKGGTIDISWGWFKSGNDYVKWNGTPPATLANIEGDKATKMSLWLVKDGDATKPVISTLEPTSYAARHKVDDVYLSDTLDYFLPKPYGLTPIIDYGHMPEVRIKPIVLSANGTIGTDEFAVSASDQYSSAYAPYICFSTSSYEAWISNASASVANPLYYTIYSKKPLNIRHITMKNRPSNIGEMLGDFVWQASTDGTQWVDLATFENRNQTAGGLVEFDMDDTHYYSYYRFKITSAATGNSGRVSIGKLTLSTFEDFFAGAVTVDDGMAYVDETSYRLTQSLTKSFEDVIVGDKAQQMFIWMIKKATQTDFVVSATAPKDVDSCYKLGATPVYLSTDLTYFRDESSSS